MSGWMKSSKCESHACAEWKLDADGLWLRNSNEPTIEIFYSAAEFEDLVSAYLRDEIVFDR